VSIPDSSLFAAAIADHRFWLAVGIAAISGLVRGFSGFGSALIYMPLVAAVYEPRVAAVTLLLIDTFSTAPFAVRSCWHCTWREVLPTFVAAAIGVPFGTMALLIADPIVLRWSMTILVLTLLGVLMSGWRYHGRPSLPLTLGVGLFSGFGGGAVQLAGPAVIVYWLGTANKVMTVRANLLVYFLLLDVTLCANYFAQRVFTPELVALSLLLGVPFFVATAVGARFFHGASDLLYRRIAYAVIAVAALISLPLFDPWVRPQ
jgi:uncharacterized membrane protein YfcA